MGASHPVPDKWEPFQDQFSDSAPEVPPTFLTCTTARLVRRHQAFEFFEPVEDEVDPGLPALVFGVPTVSELEHVVCLGYVELLD